MADTPKWDDTEPLAPSVQAGTPTWEDTDEHPDDSTLQAAKDFGMGLAQSRSYGLADEADPYVERGLSKLDIAYNKLFGDSEKAKQIEAAYNDRTNDELTDSARQQFEEAHRRSPRAYMGGMLTGEVAKQFSPFEKLTGKPGLALAGRGALSAGVEAAGMNEGNLAQRTGLEEAHPGESTMDRITKFAVPAAAGAVLPNVLQNPGAVAKYGGAAGLGLAVTPVIRKNPGLKEYGEDALGMMALAKYGPKALNNTAYGRDIKDSFNYGTEGKSLVNAADAERVQGQANDLSQNVGKGVSDLHKEVVAPAYQKIQDAYLDNVKHIGEQLGMKDKELTNYIEFQRAQAGEKINGAYQQAAQEGKTLQLSDFLSGLKTQLEDTIKQGVVPDEAGQKTTQNIINSVNERLIKKGLPIKLDTTTILNSEGQPFIQSQKIAGKNVGVGDLPQIPEGQITPKGASVETAKIGADNPYSQTTVKQTQMVTPEQPAGPMDIPAVREFKGFLQQNAFENSTVPKPVQAKLAKAYSDFGDLIAPAFNQTDANGNITNAVTENNPKYTAVKQIYDIVGMPDRDRITGEVTSQGLAKLADSVGRVVKEGDKTKFNQIFENLKVIDPDRANQFKTDIEGISGQQADLVAGVNKPAPQQLDIMQQKGMSTPELDQAGQQIKDVDSLNKNVGSLDETKLNSAGEAQPSDTTRSFVEKMADKSTIGNQDDVQASIDLLKKYKPELGQQLETQGQDISRQMQLTSSPQGPIMSKLGIIPKAPKALANMAGQGINAAKESSIGKFTSPFIENIQGLLQSNAPILGVYKERLANAAARGTAALIAANYALSNSDPAYRQKVDEFNKRFNDKNDRSIEFTNPSVVTPGK